jgi:hypothetical protein
MSALGRARNHATSADVIPSIAFATRTTGFLGNLSSRLLGFCLLRCRRAITSALHTTMVHQFK